jgi:hypothetical protein
MESSIPLQHPSLPPGYFTHPSETQSGSLPGLSGDHLTLVCFNSPTIACTNTTRGFVQGLYRETYESPPVRQAPAWLCAESFDEDQ